MGTGVSPSSAVLLLLGGYVRPEEEVAVWLELFDIEVLLVLEVFVDGRPDSGFPLMTVLPLFRRPCLLCVCESIEYRYGCVELLCPGEKSVLKCTNLDSQELGLFRVFVSFNPWRHSGSLVLFFWSSNYSGPDQAAMSGFNSFNGMA